MTGQIIKILSNDFTISYEKNIIICKARGIFRKDNITPKVGDYVIFNINDKIIEKILPRKNTLDRPFVSNVDSALIVTSLKNPDFDTNLLDKLITICNINRIEPIICLTKYDLLNDNEKNKIKNIIKYYQKIDIKVFYNTELSKIKKQFKDKTIFLTGQSGAGKSSLINKLDSSLNFETNEISKALKRGKHTTRATTLVSMYGGKVLDTPGFSSIDLSKYTNEQIKESFIEFKNYKCKYKDCLHIKEDCCAVKAAYQNKKILNTRYENYIKFIEKR